ncbi:MAG: Holliday junction branch migration DNA helicase RuvB [Desulfosarcina sp.]|nr:Holliday junction branch migration DNA helicase RuvB [Desulfosarcina sp.]
MPDRILTHSSDDTAIVDGTIQHDDRDPDILSLRPERLHEYVGQAEVVETLKIAIEAAKLRSEPLEHVIFHGPPGLGKTTLAHIIANEMGGVLTVTSGPALEKGGDLIGILTHLGEGDVLFVDEIHRTPKTVEEFLYPAMEDFAVDFVFDKGIHARSHRYRLKRFTLVGATTRVGLLSAPLRDRFGIFRSLDFYGIDDLVRITTRSAALLDVAIDEPGALELAKRSRGTPRIVNRLDDRGLTRLDHRYLKTIIDFYGGGPVGIEAISATLQEETDTLVDVVEPFLLKIGMVIRTSAGRRVPDATYCHLGVSVQQKLF